MGADKITSKILDDANNTASKIKSEAQKEADLILEKAKIEAEERKQNILKRGEKEAEMTYNRILAEARLNSKKKMLKERENLINMAIEKLKEDLKELPKKDSYKDTLLKLIIEGVISLDSNELVVLLNEKDMELIEDSALWAIERELEDKIKKVIILKKGAPVNIVGGCIIKTADGTKFCDNSLESVFERNMESIRANVASLLF